MKALLKRILPKKTVNRLIKWRGNAGPNPYQPFDDQTKSIFIHIPKTGGTSIAKALFDRGPKHRFIKNFEAYDPVRCGEYFKFSIVRNPYDRLVSAYHFLKQGGIGEHDRQWAESNLSPFDSFQDFMLALKSPSLQRKMLRHLHFIPQCEFLKSLDGKISMDFVGRFESINDDFKIIARRVKPEARIKHFNRSIHKSYDQYYTPQTLKIATQIYREDFELLNYPKELK